MHSTEKLAESGSEAAAIKSPQTATIFTSSSAGVPASRHIRRGPRVHPLPVVGGWSVFPPEPEFRFDRPPPSLGGAGGWESSARYLLLCGRSEFIQLSSSSSFSARPFDLCSTDTWNPRWPGSAIGGPRQRRRIPRRARGGIQPTLPSKPGREARRESSGHGCQLLSHL